ncbi:MAG TPA: hypothetical protein VNZ49_04380 [Bacteroidia bacterium]|jgi:hypothetical protein|nr:hypothetical protein [Bacteroidia bacterium]
METSKFFDTKKRITIPKSEISGLCNIVSTLVFLYLMLYFIIMRAVGLHEVIALRNFNIVFLSGGILLALFFYGKKSKGKIRYSTGLKIGIRITLTSVIPFTLFVYYYLLTDDGFMTFLKTKFSTGKSTILPEEYIIPATAAGITCMEGLLSGLVVTFIAMQFFREK